MSVVLDDFGNSIPEQRNDKLVDCTPEVAKPQIEHISRGLSQWEVEQDNTFAPTGCTVKGIPAGMYDIYIDAYGRQHYRLQKIITDECIRFKDSLADTILGEIENFWNIGDKFAKYKFAHRRGYLLYGSAGGGKSILVKQVVQDIISRDGIAITGDRPNLLNCCIKTFRQIEPNRIMVVILEDIDAIIQKHGEAELLSYLDGGDSSDKVLNLATTNYPEKLDKRIVARPRRFDRVIKIESPNENMRREYFNYKVGLSGEELEKWVVATDNFSFAALSDLIISVKCFGQSFEVAVNTLRKLLDSKPNSEEFKSGKTGFVK